MPGLLCCPRGPLPHLFKCPISLELMVDPVSLCTGVTYDRASIEKWMNNGHNTCPATMQVLQNRELLPNHTLRRLIQEWCNAQRSEGVEGIPTLTRPAHPQQISLLLEDIISGNGRLGAIQRLRSLATASDRNKMCIQTEGALPVLVHLLGQEPSRSDWRVMQEALSTLMLFSLDVTTKRNLLRPKQLETICWLLSKATIEARINAASLLETFAADRLTISEISAANGALEGLVRLLKMEKHPTAVKAGLKTLIPLCSSLKNRIRVVGMGTIPILVELLSSFDKGMTESVMALLDALAACAEGRAALHEHVMAFPTLVKCVPSATDIATEHALGALWSVCVHSAKEETIQAALELGAFNRLLLLMHMECTPRAKQRVKDLFKLFSEV